VFVAPPVPVTPPVPTFVPPVPLLVPPVPALLPPVPVVPPVLLTPPVPVPVDPPVPVVPPEPPAQAAAAIAIGRANRIREREPSLPSRGRASIKSFSRLEGRGASILPEPSFLEYVA
jgi:hypothetical protein